MSEIKELLKPLQIGGMTLKNRVFMSPMMVGRETEDGRMSPNTVRYLLERAKGGVGCIITEMMSADPNAGMSYGGTKTKSMKLENSGLRDSYRAFIDEIHSYGTKVIPQLAIPGPDGASSGEATPAPSVCINVNGVKTRELKKEEIPMIVQAFANMAKQAKEFGFDGVQLHSAHGYMMLGSFLSPIRNKRTDEYGGDILNRGRLLIETLIAIKKEVGRDFPVIIRLSGDEKTPGGNTLDEILLLAPYLVEAGADALEVSGGSNDTPQKSSPCLDDGPQGINTPQSSALKAAVNVPVTVVGKIQDPRFAESIIASGKADAVVVGRALLSDPEWLNKAAQGRFDDIAPCAGCGVGCLQSLYSGGQVSCVINPAVGREEEFEIRPALKEKKVVVVGGGMAGMAAACTAAKRGHKVVLMEKASEVGGQIRLACRSPFKQPLSKWVVYYSGQLKKLGVTVKLDTHADERSVAAENPDSVIIATGARSTTPPFSGVDGQNVHQAWDIILDNPPIITGNVVIIGGGSVGLETAELLTEQAKGPLHITIVEMLPDVGVDLFFINKLTVMKHLLGAGVSIQTNTKVLEIQPGKVCCEKNGQPVCFENVTHVILACGSKSDNALYESLKQKFNEIILVGDAEKPSKALKAVEDGTRAALSI